MQFIISCLVVLLIFLRPDAGSFVEMPMSPCKMGRITWYNYVQDGACMLGEDFGTPRIPAGTIGAALNEDFFNNSEHCGECYELTGRRGTHVVMAIDNCPSSSMCDGTYDHFDLTDEYDGEAAFELFADSVLGNALIQYRLVSCPVVGYMGIHVKDGSDSNWFALQVYNHRVGVEKVEVRPAGEISWINCPRSFYNYFVWEEHRDADVPLDIRIYSNTSPQQIRETSIPRILEYETHDTGVQFDDVPEGYGGGSSDEHCIALGAGPWLYTEGNVEYGWYDWSWTATTQFDVRTDPFDGESCSRAVLGSWGALSFGRNDPLPLLSFTNLSFAIRGDGSEQNLMVSLNDDESDDVTVYLTSISTEWTIYSYPLESFGSPSEADYVNFKNEQSSTVTIWFDVILFTGEGDPCENIDCAHEGTCETRESAIPVCVCPDGCIGTYCEDCSSRSLTGGLGWNIAAIVASVGGISCALAIGVAFWVWERKKHSQPIIPSKSEFSASGSAKSGSTKSSCASATQSSPRKTSHSTPHRPAPLPPAAEHPIVSSSHPVPPRRPSRRI